MGGGRASIAEEESSLENDYSELASQPTDSLSDTLNVKAENGTVVGKSCLGFGQFGHLVHDFHSLSVDLDAHQRRERRVYEEIMKSYNDLQIRGEFLKEEKSRVLSYKPGAWIELEVGTELSDYDVPKTTAILLVGPKGSGKSSLVNRISRLLEDDKFAPDRAQVSGNSSVGDGTYFLQEYMIPKGSTSFCLYDTRGISDDSPDNINLLRRWMTKGVCHGALVIRDSDSLSLRTRMKHKARQSGCNSSKTRVVNFVIFVVNGLSVLESMNSDEAAREKYNKLIASTFNCPYLSFKDDKPVVVVTHGDLLSLPERAQIRTHLGELLGISPVKQIFDIPDDCDPTTDLTILDMLRYSLEHADKNFPCRDKLLVKVRTASLLLCILLLMVLGIAVSIDHFHHGRMQHAPKSRPRINWHEIRHLW